MKQYPKESRQSWRIQNWLMIERFFFIEYLEENN